VSIPEVSSRNRLLQFLGKYLTFTLNPKFFAYLSSTQLNITDDASTTIGFDTVKSDVTTSYSTTSYTFSAPKAGSYFFRSQCMLKNIPTNTTAVGYLRFVHADSDGSSLGNYVGSYYTFHDFNSDSNFQYFPMYASAVIVMSVGDTITVQIGLSGVGGDTVDIFGHSSNLGATGFSGFLIP